MYIVSLKNIFFKKVKGLKRKFFDWSQRWRCYSRILVSVMLVYVIRLITYFNGYLVVSWGDLYTVLQSLFRWNEYTGLSCHQNYFYFGQFTFIQLQLHYNWHSSKINNVSFNKGSFISKKMLMGGWIKT